MFITIEVLMFFVTVLGILHLWIRYHYSYWQRHNVPYISSTLPFGNIKDIILLKNSAAECLQELYNYEGAKNQPFIGIHIFHQPTLLIRDLELIKRILIKDFNKFSNRLSASDPKIEFAANGVFFMKNPLWKEMRIKLTSLFTSGKMKQMFILIKKNGEDLDQYLHSLSQSEGSITSLEVKEICALYTTDVIISSVFGVEANCFKNPEGEFRRYGRAVFDFSFSRAIVFILRFFLPQVAAFFRINLFPKNVINFIRKTVQNVMDEREKSGIVRNDLINTLIHLKNAPNDDKNDLKFVGDILYAQAGNFYIAGFETSASTMAFALYELAKKPECQKRLRDEIKDLLQSSNGEYDYDAVMNMPYLNMVIQETLRLYPPLPFLDRVCTLSKDETGYSLEPFGEYSIPNGMPVFIPIYGIQRDPKYFFDPDNFDPERFSPENKLNHHPMTNLAFGTGQRNCMGERFGLMNSKIGLINFLRNHYVKPSKNFHQTMKLEKKALILQSKGGIYCDIIRDPLFIET